MPDAEGLAGLGPDALDQDTLVTAVGVGDHRIPGVYAALLLGDAGVVALDVRQGRALRRKDAVLGVLHEGAGGVPAHGVSAAKAGEPEEQSVAVIQPAAVFCSAAAVPAIGRPTATTNATVSTVRLRST
ncbi:hypothetical protein [Streptomyces xinghaiensis]|uniref:hypothetical protein n=1 Tax=Streptomyces xinghaiensis TaxID=1038928 RepID=UPI000592F772|nr:hypothetical protein [Streptomyces xinghaiensis]MZE80968.1 hypothetical protein [Streptomyces sp. SID5475]